MPLASVADLSIHLNRTFTGTALQQAEMHLEKASAEVRVYCRQSIEYVENDVVDLVGNWGSTLVLPERPVIDVTSVTVDGTVLTGDGSWAWDGRDLLYRGNWTDLDGAWSPQSQRPLLYWGGDEAVVQVTYSHGYQAIPLLIVGIVCALAGRTISNPTSDKQETLGPYAVTPAAPGLLWSERRSLREGGYRR